MLMCPRCKVCDKTVRTMVVSPTLLYDFVTCEDCKQERNSMKIIIGTEIEFGGEKFQVVNIRREDTTEGKVLYLAAYDPSMADKEQQTRIKMSQTGDGLIDMIKGMIEKGKKGDFGGGMGIGGV